MLTAAIVQVCPPWHCSASHAFYLTIACWFAPQVIMVITKKRAPYRLYWGSLQICELQTEFVKLFANQIWADSIIPNIYLTFSTYMFLYHRLSYIEWKKNSHEVGLLIYINKSSPNHYRLPAKTTTQSRPKQYQLRRVQQ